MIGYPLFVSFFPPLIAGPTVNHREMMRSVELAGKSPEYDQWRARVAKVAERYGVELWDFTQQNSYHQSDLSNVSNAYYIDASHFQPDTIGRWILERIGVANQTDNSQYFGKHLMKDVE